MASLLARYLRASQSRPVAVQFATGALVMAAGDATTQAAVERQALFDPQRNATAAVFNGGVSPALYKWYGLLDRVWPGSALRQLAPKLLLNQAVSSSLISPSFLCWSSCVEAALAGRLSAASGRAKVASDTYQRLRADVRRIVCTSFMLWLPVTPSHCRAALSCKFTARLCRVGQRDQLCFRAAASAHRIHVRRGVRLGRIPLVRGSSRDGAGRANDQQYCLRPSVRERLCWHHVWIFLPVLLAPERAPSLGFAECPSSKFFFPTC